MVILKQLVHEKVDWYLDELVYEMERMTEKRASLHKAAQERNECACSSFIAKIKENYTHDQLIFLDESSKDERSLTHYYEYSSVNTCAQKKIVFVRGKCYIILPALTIDEIIALDIIEAPYPEKNSVIIMDNARIHHDEELVRDFFDSSDDPVYVLKVACAHITSNMANAFFNASIYSDEIIKISYEAFAF
ncbi:15855_t:CDS:2 [Gigaspora margarita]|uniref:15855_t:CDS:1 n=1 Tax=Gigaspora margarita TaxID=4874 RepID=A0ABN7VT02_GIGMA|nr:15855_t:CDS:2 [Gigaspora margarita]